ncbi:MULTISPECIES: phage tail protein [Pseudomonas]|jgi:phage protein U/prefoldin subunit 5|uniref:phage tail protein n=1 Tax=Pseudomonas TaxID=286 RepID=UPI0005BA64F8|nr:MULTISPECIES: phage tail protein [Pseudomonas]KWR71284.1 phage tail protein [Pseudomonas sp. PI1]WAB94609.1 phage tail protein [Pseudomonas citronellolis]
MAYMEQLQAGLRSIGQAIEAGRRELKGTIDPLDQAIGELQDASGQLEKLLSLPPGVSAQLQRVMRGIDQANARLDKVVAVYSKAERAVQRVDERLDALGRQAARAGQAINRIAGAISPKLANIIPSELLAPLTTPAAEAVKPQPHLLVMRPLAPNATPFYFNLSTAAFDKLVRDTQYSWVPQARLDRRPALQSPGQGAETLSLSGTIATLLGAGVGQLQKLRDIAARREPLSLSSWSGQLLGNWCITRIGENQSSLLSDGVPRSQAFTLEFTRYGDDL